MHLYAFYYISYKLDISLQANYFAIIKLLTLDFCFLSYHLTFCFFASIFRSCTPCSTEKQAVHGGPVTPMCI